QYEAPPEAPSAQEKIDVPSAAGDDAATTQKPIARRSYLGFALGFAAASLAGAAMASSGAVDIAFGEKYSRVARFEQEHQRSIPQLNSAIDSLKTVEADVQRRQRENPEQLAKIAGERLVPLRRLD